ncbi:MAG TPA: GDSL-type esterase/lipase family protein [Acidobacteriaceae bacterium]|nr:GDSL-type esterase/lipase family protein [Acidobacteriaceae bacterium]
MKRARNVQQSMGMHLRRWYLLGFLAVLWIPLGCRLLNADSRVAFLGDSIIWKWPYPRANFGVQGNTTQQMFMRLPSILSTGRYKQIVILGGTNDLLENIDQRSTLGNLEEIGQSSAAAGAQPVLCEIPPIFHDYKGGGSTDYSERVRSLNQGIAQLAERHHWKLIDYYDPMVGHPDYFSDGVHLKRRGYLVMELTYLREAPVQP